MFQVKKNDKTMKELIDYAATTGLSLREVLLSESHLQQVSSIFYAHMPKLVRMTMNKEKFTNFYNQHKETFVNSLSV